MARDIVVDVQVGGVGATADANTPAAASPSVVPTGQTGAYSTFEIVETVTGEAGTEAKAENLGTKTAVKLKLTIPRGGKGDQGESAYEAAKKEGYTGTKEEFGKEWATIKAAAQKVEKDAEAARESARDANEAVQTVIEAAEAAFAAQSGAENARDDAAAHEQAAGESADAAGSRAMEAYDSARAASAFAQAASEAKESAKSASEDAAGSAAAAASNAGNAAVSEAEAKKAQAAAEKARDEAQQIAGGDFASPDYVDSKAAEAENNANEYTDQKIAAIPTPDVSKQISEHNVSGESHNDMRLLIAGLTERLNVLANSDDTTLDQMAEVVEYIKDNRELIEQITTGKVSVSDIVDNLTTNVTNKPLSAAQGVALKALVEAAAAAAAAAQSTANGKATMSEVNAAISDAIEKIPTPDVSGQINTHNQSTEAHPAIQQRLEVLENKGGGNSNITFATEEPTEEDGADGELRLVYTPESETPALPEGYTQVEYIEATGSQYIDTDFKPQYNSRVVADISDLANVSGFVFGTRNSASAEQFAAYRANATTFRSDYFATQQSTTLADSTARTTIDKNGNVLTAYGLTITNTAVSSGGCNYPLFLFALNSTGSPLVFASYKLYSCQIYDNVALVRDYTPCINPSGVVGLYDLVNGVFYADAAGGTFTAGDAIEIKAPGKESDDSGEGYFKVDGKWYKLLPAALTAAEIRAICI